MSNPWSVAVSPIDAVGVKLALEHCKDQGNCGEEAKEMQQPHKDEDADKLLHHSFTGGQQLVSGKAGPHPRLLTILLKGLPQPPYSPAVTCNRHNIPTPE